MAMLTIEEVIAELGRETSQTLLSKGDLRQVRRHFHDYAFRYSRREGGGIYCSGCGSEIEEPRYGEKHRDWVRCPECCKAVQLYDEWRGHKYLFEQTVVYLWTRSETAPDTILVKAIHAEKHFGRPQPHNTGLTATVTALYQFSPKGARKYVRNYVGTFTQNMRSVTAEENKHGCSCEYAHVGLKEALQGTRLEYVAEEFTLRLTQEHRDMDPIIAMTEAARKPYLEYVIRKEQRLLANDIMHGLYKPRKRAAKSMPELLGLTEGQWYEAWRDGIKLRAEILHALEDLQAAGNMTLTLAEALRATTVNGQYSRQRLKKLAADHFARIPPKLRRKAVRRAGLSRDLNEWVDYWEQLAQLGEDMSDSRLLLPKDMHAMHQRMTERINVLREEEWARQKLADAQRDAENQRRFEEELLPQLRMRYTFEACGLILRPFESAAEVIAEGTKQHICVGGYAARYIRGETILCALRRAEAPEEPWRTVEFAAASGHLVQDRGAYNDRGAGEGNLRNGVGGWLKRFWAAFEEHRSDKKGREAA